MGGEAGGTRPFASGREDRATDCTVVGKARGVSRFVFMGGDERAPNSRLVGEGAGVDSSGAEGDETVLPGLGGSVFRYGVGGDLRCGGRAIRVGGCDFDSSGNGGTRHVNHDRRALCWG